MDLQYYGANCVTITRKNVRIVIDDNLADLGSKGILKADDIAIFTGAHGQTTGRLVIDGPGEYEVADISIIGIATQSHLEERGGTSSTMYKLITSNVSVLITGHIYPEVNESMLESIGMIDVLVIPVGGNGYTLDAVGALKLIKGIEPKLIVPTHYSDTSLHYPVPQTELDSILKDLSMEPKERISKLRLKAGEFSDVTQLVVLQKV